MDQVIKNTVWVRQNIAYDAFEADYDQSFERFPVETLEQRTGDCEDTAALVASICLAQGIDASLLSIPGSDTSSGHMAVLIPSEIGMRRDVYEGKIQFSYVETTGRLGHPVSKEDVFIGVPREYHGRKMERITLD